MWGPFIPPHSKHHDKRPFPFPCHPSSAVSVHNVTHSRLQGAKKSPLPPRKKRKKRPTTSKMVKRTFRIFHFKPLLKRLETALPKPLVLSPLNEIHPLVSVTAKAFVPKELPNQQQVRQWWRFPAAISETDKARFQFTLGCLPSGRSETSKDMFWRRIV